MSLRTFFQQQLKNLIRVSSLTAGTTLVIGLSSVNAQNLVVNGTFDNYLNGWDIITTPWAGRFEWDQLGFAGGSARGDRVEPGPESAVSSRVLGQLIPTTIGDTYTIAFQLLNQGASSLSVYFGGNVFSVPGLFSSEWQTYFFERTAERSDTLLTFVYSDSDQSVYIDNISVRAADVPGPLPLLGFGVAFAFARHLRKRIKRCRLGQVLH